MSNLLFLLNTEYISDPRATKIVNSVKEKFNNIHIFCNLDHKDKITKKRLQKIDNVKIYRVKRWRLVKSILNFFRNNKLTKKNYEKVRTMKLNYDPKVEKSFFKNTISVLIEFRGFLSMIISNLFLFFKARKVNYDVVQANDLDTLLASYLLSKKNSAKLIYDSREFFTDAGYFKTNFAKKCYSFLESLLIKKCDRVIAVSNGRAKKLEEKYNIRGVKIIRNLVIIEKFKTKPKSKFKTNKMKLVYLGVFNRNRGLLETTKAMGKVDEAILYIMGRGEIEKDLKSLVSSLDINDKVVFLGYIGGEKKWDILRQMDIGLIPFLPDSVNTIIGIPNKIFEYMNAGLAVGVSNAQLETSKIIKKEKIGFIFDPTDPNDIAKKINKAISNKEEIKTWKNNSLNSIKNYSWKKEEEKLINIYEDLIQ